MEFVFEYGLFLAKLATFAVGAALMVAAFGMLRRRGGKPKRGQLEVRCLNKAVGEMADALVDATLTSAERKKRAKLKRKAKSNDRTLATSIDAQVRKRVFVIDFDGDLRASAVAELREEITAVLSLATELDEIVVRLESAGGMVHSYGLGASQLDRVKAKGMALTVCVDKIAASGGYLMACVGDRIVAAPFAIIGSIGVYAQVPNLHRLLKKHAIDIELMTAGKYKRTLTVLGENTDQGREKFREDLEDTHRLFKEFVSARRPGVAIDEVATGETWFGSRARALKLVDELRTSDDYLVAQFDHADVYEVAFVRKKNLPRRLGLAAVAGIEHLVLRWLRDLGVLRGAR